jgi:hypothetical protein
MKTTHFRLLLILGLILPISASQAQTFQIDSTFENARDTIRQFHRGDMITVATDSVYMLNQIQLNYYRLLMNLKVSVGQDNEKLQKVFDELVKNVNSNLTTLTVLNAQMKKNADSTGVIADKLANLTLKNVAKADSLLAKADSSMKQAQIKLDSADAHLVKANEYIKKEKKLQFWRKVKYTAIGLGVGILVTSIFK